MSGVVDPEGQPITIRFTSILQDEPTDSAGQGNTKQDGGIEQNGARGVGPLGAERHQQGSR